MREIKGDKSGIAKSAASAGQRHKYGERKRMKQLIFLLLTLSLTLGFLATSYAEDKDFDARSASDVNTDGFVNILDLTFIASHLGEMPAEDATPNPDVNRDGTVNILDLVLAANSLGKTSGIPFEVTDTKLLTTLYQVPNFRSS